MIRCGGGAAPPPHRKNTTRVVLTDTCLRGRARRGWGLMDVLQITFVEGAEQKVLSVRG